MTGRLTEQLPRVLAQDPFLQGFLGIFEEISGSVQNRLDHLDIYLSLDSAPLSFVRWIGGWVGVQIDQSLPEDRQRNLARAAGRSLGWRGTRRGLQELLAALTAGTVRIEDDGGVSGQQGASPGSRRIRVRLSQTGGVEQRALLAFIAAEVPADALIELAVDDRMVAGPADTPPAAAGQNTGAIQAQGDTMLLPRLGPGRPAAGPQPH